MFKTMQSKRNQLGTNQPAQRRKVSGQSLAEFSICAIVVMLLVFGVVDLGRGVFAYNTISNAAREGARYAMVHGSNGVLCVGPGTNDPTLTSVVMKYTAGLQTNNLSVFSTWPNGNGTGAVVNVTVQYTFNPVLAFFRTLSLSNQSSAIILH